MKRGSQAGRGYGYAHKQRRAAEARRVAAGEAFCSRCGRWIHPLARWHLDHNDEDRSVYYGPTHASCNVAAANKRRRHKARAPRVTSHAW